MDGFKICSRCKKELLGIQVQALEELVEEQKRILGVFLTALYGSTQAHQK